MRARDFRNAAWKKLNGNWTVAVVSFLIYDLIIALITITGIGAIATFILSGAFLVGMMALCLKISRNGSGNIEDIFTGFKVGLGSNMVAGMLVTLYTFLWSLLFVIPGIVKSYSYAMTFYILADNPDMAPSEAITRSREMMRGNKWRLFCLDLSFIGWFLLAVLTLGILTLWITPYQNMARTEFYESLRGEKAEPATFEGGIADGSDAGTQL